MTLVKHANNVLVTMLDLDIVQAYDKGRWQLSSRFAKPAAEI